MTVVARMNFVFGGISYPFEMDFETDEAVEYLFAEGNYGCDCNRCLFIQRTNPEFNNDEDMECGDAIAMTDFRIEPR
jgi:hypothetical protein